MFCRILFLLLIISNVCLSQSRSDSLKRVIATTKIDTAKVWTLIALGNEIEASQPDEAYKYYKEAEAISRRINYPLGICKAISNFTYILDLKNKLSESKKYYEEAVKIARNHKLGILEGKSLANLGSWHYRNLELVNAVKCYTEASKILKNYHDIETSMVLRANIANIYKDLKRYDEALKMCDELEHEIKKSGRNNITLVQVLLNKAGCLTDLEKWAQSVPVLENTLAISQELQYKEGICAAFNNLSVSYRRTHQLDKSFVASSKTLSAAQEIGDIDGVRMAYHNIGFCYLHQKQADSSEKYFAKSLDLAIKNNLQKDVSSNYSGMSYVKLLKGDIDGWLRFSAKADSIEVLQTGEEVRDAASDIEGKYQLSLKENEILKKENELKQSKINLWLLFGGFLAILTIGGTLFYGYQKKQQTQRLVAELAAQKRERQRIAAEMHDELGGNLTSLMYVAHQSKMKTSDNENVDKIMQISSNISDNINEIVWSLNQEKNSLKDWVIYCKGRLADILDNSALEYHFNISAKIPERTLDYTQKRNLYLVIKEAVNNAIKHANASSIVLNFDFNEGILIEIIDNGLGMTPNPNTKAGTGNGLRSMNQRIEEIGGKIDWKNHNGTTVVVKLI
jgi:two-component system, NarL family, sensor kinase